MRAGLLPSREVLSRREERLPGAEKMGPPQRKTGPRQKLQAGLELPNPAFPMARPRLAN